MSATQPGPECAVMLAGVLAHVSSYLNTGCPRAAQQARLLLHRLDASALDRDLAASCELLDQAISNRHCQ
ncbi:hypothetical protein [Thauera sinica]|uniref:Uncharacterized protein n=1 Tax=Thauera sinica TaxID=2665146 RepID=A0ABW1AW98_9RHOO|nr:hypothetical protein [Thauera sp. K11]ATE61097.1 hypothetical protein CCZ27_15160 [Thauera sp. K11]